MIDFGLAQELEPGERMKALKGTPEFMGEKLTHFMSNDASSVINVSCKISAWPSLDK